MLFTASKHKLLSYARIPLAGRARGHAWSRDLCQRSAKDLRYHGHRIYSILKTLFMDQAGFFTQVEPYHYNDCCHLSQKSSSFLLQHSPFIETQEKMLSALWVSRQNGSKGWTHHFALCSEDIILLFRIEQRIFKKAKTPEELARFHHPDPLFAKGFLGGSRMAE